MTTIQTAQNDNDAHILIIDDDESIAALLKHLFEREGYKVTIIFDGIEARDYIASTQTPPTLVLMEMLLPSIGGYDLLEFIRAMPTWEEVPVVGLSTLSQEEEIVRFLKMGAKDYVTKPFRVNELVTRVSRLA